MFLTRTQIERLLRDGKIPVIVGGTHYYIESLLWKVLLDDEPGDDPDPELLYDKPVRQSTDVADDADDERLLRTTTFDQEGLPHLSSPRLHRLLESVDPEMADAIHPNNRRKIIR